MNLQFTQIHGRSGVPEYEDRIYRIYRTEIVASVTFSSIGVRCELESRDPPSLRYGAASLFSYKIYFRRA
jgi:hypothetical protein